MAHSGAEIQHVCTDLEVGLVLHGRQVFQGGAVVKLVEHHDLQTRESEARSNQKRIASRRDPHLIVGVCVDELDSNMRSNKTGATSEQDVLGDVAIATQRQV